MAFKESQENIHRKWQCDIFGKRFIGESLPDLASSWMQTKVGWKRKYKTISAFGSSTPDSPQKGSGFEEGFLFPRTLSKLDPSESTQFL